MDNISHSQYKLIRKAAELEEIRERLALIADMNAAFNANKKHINHLEKEFHKIAGHNHIVNTPPDSDWKSKLLRFKR